MQNCLLRVEDLTTSFLLRSGWHPAVCNVSFSLSTDETLALVGESGCGKSVTAYTIMGLLPEPGSRVDGGRVLFGGEDLLKASNARMRQIRGHRMTMIFQEPMSSLNPVLTIGRQISETIYYHEDISWAESRVKAVQLLEQVKIPSAEKRLKDYPHQLSGGMQQRVMIAIALAGKPDLIIADEPTTALDVTIQAQVLYLLQNLKQQLRMSMIFITHDLSVVAQIADRVAVMYAGNIVEIAKVKELFANPLHPYTQALFHSTPRVDTDVEEIRPIRGLVPPIDGMPAGCRFAARCELAVDMCRQQMPDIALYDGRGSHMVRCWARADLHVDSEGRQDD